MRLRRYLKILLAAYSVATLPARAATNVLGGGSISSLGTGVNTIGFVNFPILFQPTWQCVHSNGTACTSAELQNSWYKQIVIMPSGYGDADYNQFFADFNRTISLMTNSWSAGSSWSVQKASQLLFIGYWVSGGPLGDPSAAFGGKIAPHPIRGYATSLSQNAVYSKIDSIRYSQLPSLRPIGVAVIFNTFQQPITANAAPPSFVNRPFGVAKYTRGDLDARGAYVPTHELAHASLNYLDEYIEAGFENLSIKQIDVATPLVLFDWTWGGFINAINDLLGVYDYTISDMLANNGNDNVATSSWPTTVTTNGYPWQNYSYEGGMFFGLGTFHQAGSNLMNSDSSLNRGADDGFGYAHSPSQQQVVDELFWGYTARPNDRIRNAGPKNGWPLAFGSQTHVMLFDGDKNHHFHPTEQYNVQVGWYDRQWHTCWWGPFPYPCYNDVWTTAMTSVYPEYRAINLPLSSAYGLAKLAQKLVCAVGINEISSGGGTIRLCDQDLDTIANNFLPTINFPVPYQDVSVPASQWFTTYWWRFNTDNGAIQSGYTGWSSFYRSF
jgi:hypothetical protein